MAQRLHELRQHRPVARTVDETRAEHDDRELLAADWKKTESGREAKFYRLTKKGRAQLGAETASWQRLSEAVGLILKLSEGGAE